MPLNDSGQSRMFECTYLNANAKDQNTIYTAFIMFFFKCTREVTYFNLLNKFFRYVFFIILYLTFFPRITQNNQNITFSGGKTNTQTEQNVNIKLCNVK